MSAVLSPELPPDSPGSKSQGVSHAIEAAVGSNIAPAPWMDKLIEQINSIRPAEPGDVPVTQAELDAVELQANISAFYQNGWLKQPGRKEQAGIPRMNAAYEQDLDTREEQYIGTGYPSDDGDV